MIGVLVQRCISQGDSPLYVGFHRLQTRSRRSCAPVTRPTICATTATWSVGDRACPATRGTTIGWRSRAPCGRRCCSVKMVNMPVSVHKACFTGRPKPITTTEQPNPEVDNVQATTEATTAAATDAAETADATTPAPLRRSVKPVARSAFNPCDAEEFDDKCIAVDRIDDLDWQYCSDMAQWCRVTLPEEVNREQENTVPPGRVQLAKHNALVDSRIRPVITTTTAAPAARPQQTIQQRRSPMAVGVVSELDQ